jgi:small ligand-binding sensory domain FIST
MMGLDPSAWSVLAKGRGAGQIAEAAAEMLALNGADGTFGFIYATDTLQVRLPEVVARLQTLTGVEDWVGTLGFGVMAGRHAAFDEPAIAVMLTNWPKQHYKLFQGGQGKDDLIANAGPVTGIATAIVHADPRNQRFPGLLQSLSATTGAYLVGGITASRNGCCDQVAGPAAEGGISGVLLGPAIGMAVGVCQGCIAAGPVRTVTAAERNLILELDGVPPLEALFQDLHLARADGIDALYKALETLHVALLVPNCDTGDYLVRNLAGIDTESGVIAIGDRAEPGQKLFFARRDRPAAVSGLKAMARKVRARAGGMSGALYVSCCGRGPHLFTSAEEEIGLVQDALGGIPLAGFYANGEIAGERIYGYTGVLAIF